MRAEDVLLFKYFIAKSLCAVNLIGLLDIFS